MFMGSVSFLISRLLIIIYILENYLEIVFQKIQNFGAYKIIDIHKVLPAHLVFLIASSGEKIIRLYLNENTALVFAQVDISVIRDIVDLIIVIPFYCILSC